MRREFVHLLTPDGDHFKALWRGALIIPDTNVLLSLYGYSPATREELLRLLAAVKERLWIPHQVGWEFFNNRVGRIHEVERRAESALDEVATTLQKQREELQREHPKYAAAIDAVMKEAARAKELVASGRDARLLADDSDPILTSILDLFDGKVGLEPEESWLKSRCEEGKARYADSVPPGYADAKAKKDAGDPRLYGDYLLWREVLDRCKKEERPAIIVTDDVKDDWFLRAGGRLWGPRPELIKEFRQTAKNSFWAYSTRAFLQHAPEHIGGAVVESAVEEAGEVERAALARLVEFQRAAEAAREQLRSSNAFQSVADLQAALRFAVDDKDLAKWLAVVEASPAAGRVPLPSPSIVRVLDEMSRTGDRMARIRLRSDWYEHLRTAALDEAIREAARQAVEEHTERSESGSPHDDAGKEDGEEQ